MRQQVAKIILEPRHKRPQPKVRRPPSLEKFDDTQNQEKTSTLKINPYLELTENDSCIIETQPFDTYTQWASLH